MWNRGENDDQDDFLLTYYLTLLKRTCSYISIILLICMNVRTCTYISTYHNRRWRGRIVLYLECDHCHNRFNLIFVILFFLFSYFHIFVFFLFSYFRLNVIITVKENGFQLVYQTYVLTVLTM